MPKWTDYTTKTYPADNDTLMIYDAAAKANKLSPFSGVWNWIVGKLTNAVISNLRTNNQTVLGAINELNSKTGTIYSKGIENYGTAYNAVVIRASNIRDLGLFIILSGDSITQFVTFIYGASDNKVSHTDIVNNGNVSVTGDLTNSSITIKIGNWGRGVVFSYSPFEIERKQL
jgi:hypothetical protein|nr:MAG TPA: hypothetical protein [Caudoviricetes sp.]